MSRSPAAAAVRRPAAAHRGCPGDRHRARRPLFDEPLSSWMRTCARRCASSSASRGRWGSPRFSSHDQSRPVDDHVVLMHNGRIEQAGTRTSSTIGRAPSAARFCDVNEISGVVIDNAGETARCSWQRAPFCRWPRDRRFRGTSNCCCARSGHGSCARRSRVQMLLRSKARSQVLASACWCATPSIAGPTHRCPSASRRRCLPSR